MYKIKKVIVLSKGLIFDLIKITIFEITHVDWNLYIDTQIDKNIIILFFKPSNHICKYLKSYSNRSILSF
jgi:hypothetical protein